MFDGSTMKGIREAVSSYAASFDPNQITAVTAQGVVDDAIATENMLATIKALAAKKVADTKLWEREGHMSPAHQLAKKSGTSVAKAKETLETAEALAKLPGLDAAARAGEVSSSQAGAIADAATKNPKAEERLVKLAKKGSLGELKDECARTKAAAEPDPAAAHRAIHRSRFLRRRRTVDGAGEITYRSTLEEVSEIWSIVQGHAQRIFEKARAEGRREPEEAYLADGLLAATRAAAKAAAKAAADARAAAKKRAASSTAAGVGTPGGASGGGASDPASGSTGGPTSTGGTSGPATEARGGPSTGGASDPASGPAGGPTSTGGTSERPTGPAGGPTSTGGTSEPPTGPAGGPPSTGGTSEPPRGSTVGRSTGRRDGSATPSTPRPAAEAGAAADGEITGWPVREGPRREGPAVRREGPGGEGAPEGQGPVPGGSPHSDTGGSGPVSGGSPHSDNGDSEPVSGGSSDLDTDGSEEPVTDDPMAPPVRPAKVIVRIDWETLVRAGP
ncbi:MAG TPA: DUF222 domain-containing protein [Acidimicrobiales bacterium]|nr:DUF222 domain-containing protein [Acidimicrobiales bacterium]